MCQDNVSHKKQKKKQCKPQKGISLNPLEFDEAVADILKVKPEPKAKSKPETKE